MSRADHVEFARRIALRLLESRPRTEKELRDALAKKNVPAEVAHELLTRFNEVGLVNDSVFATALVNTRSQVAFRGRMRIREELRSKGIDQDIAEAALAELPPEDELAAAVALAGRKARSMRGLEPAVATRRLYAALARRGFSPSVVRSAVEAATGEWLGDVD